MRGSGGIQPTIRRKRCDITARAHWENPKASHVDPATGKPEVGSIDWEKALAGEDFGAREATEVEKRTNFFDNSEVLNWDTDHTMLVPTGAGAFGLGSKPISAMNATPLT